MGSHVQDQDGVGTLGVHVNVPQSSADDVEEAVPIRHRDRDKIDVLDDDEIFENNPTTNIRNASSRSNISAAAGSRPRLTTKETSSRIQPGRHTGSLLGEDSTSYLAKAKTITIPQAKEFFGSLEPTLMGINILVSSLITALVLYVFPEEWHSTLTDSSQSVAVLGALLSFALVFRTQTCYTRWWEARSRWGVMISACWQISAQARAWFGDEDSVDRFLIYCSIFPYACKAVLRGNSLLDPELEEGMRFVDEGKIAEADLLGISRYGLSPLTCLEAMRRLMMEALQDNKSCRVSPTAVSSAFLAMEQVMFQLNLCFGACLKIKSTKMPVSYTLFMRTFVFFFFMLVSLCWAARIKWFTPIVSGIMVFLMNTVIVIGEQMLTPFELQWSGLPLKKYCVIIENEIANISRRHHEIDCLFPSKKEE